MPKTKLMGSQRAVINGSDNHSDEIKRDKMADKIIAAKIAELADKSGAT